MMTRGQVNQIIYDLENQREILVKSVSGRDLFDLSIEEAYNLYSEYDKLKFGTHLLMRVIKD